MKYYKISIVIFEGRLAFSEVTEGFMTSEEFESGVWDKPITKIMTPTNEMHFMAFHKDYLDAMIAGIALVGELKAMGWNIGN